MYDGEEVQILLQYVSDYIQQFFIPSAIIGVLRPKIVNVMVAKKQHDFVRIASFQFYYVLELSERFFERDTLVWIRVKIVTKEYDFTVSVYVACGFSPECATVYVWYYKYIVLHLSLLILCCYAAR